MRSRFIRVLALLALLAGAFAGVARALDFDDEDPDPVRAEVGQMVDYEIGTHAGCLPHRLVILSGQLPPGLQLLQINDHTGAVEGIPTEAGVWNVWLAVRDCDNRSAESLFTFEIARRSFAIKTTSLPAATAGSPYSARLEAGDRPVRSVKWSVTAGALPAGLALAEDGTISGSPTASGVSSFTVTVTSDGDDGEIRMDSRQFTLNVVGQLSATVSARAAEVGIPFRATLAATGGQSPYTWTATGGTPEGLSVGSNGVVSGVPTRAGSYTLTAHLVDANGAVKDVQLQLVVRPRLAIATKRLAAAVARRAYRVRIAVRGGVGPLRWSISRGSLPRGLRLAVQTGTIAGVPAVAGSFRITVRARDALGALSTKTLVLRVH
jgi:large repetitive protein